MSRVFTSGKRASLCRCCPAESCRDVCSAARTSTGATFVGQWAECLLSRFSWAGQPDRRRLVSGVPTSTPPPHRPCPLTAGGRSWSWTAVQVGLSWGQMQLELLPRPIAAPRSLAATARPQPSPLERLVEAFALSAVDNRNTRRAYLGPSAKGFSDDSGRRARAAYSPPPGGPACGHHGFRSGHVLKGSGHHGDEGVPRLAGWPRRRASPSLPCRSCPPASPRAESSHQCGACHPDGGGGHQGARARPRGHRRPCDGDRPLGCRPPGRRAVRPRRRRCDHRPSGPRRCRSRPG